ISKVSYIQCMKYLPVLIIICFLFLPGSAAAQKKPLLPKGKLFIIGGGDRPPSLMKCLLVTAAMGPKDYVVVLPMCLLHNSHSVNKDSCFKY
ncbi:MAG TPA: hypothetical protein VEP90_29500, partial [Methylomirabilota bacterium]|nr:hypothetical protein [Methylomirabilota bacterium]